MRDWEWERRPGLRRLKRFGVAAICAAVVASAPAVALAEGSSTLKEGGLGAAAAVASIIYGPTKIVYALGGSVIGGMAWVFSGGDSEVAGTVVTRAVRGTYVLTPDSLTGNESIEFVGRSPEYRAAADMGTQVATAPDAPDGW
jgi:hypothetical protein